MSNIYEKYEARGLDNFKLSSLEDIKEIYGFNIPMIKGYEDLSEEKKKLFNKFIVNFFNAHGMDRRSTLEPLQVNYVQHTEYSRPSANVDDDGTAIHELVITEIKRLTPSGKYTRYLKHTFCKNASIAGCKGYTTCFLRIDYKWGKRKEWLHILSPDQWY